MGTKLKIGDNVIWLGGWGKEAPKQVKITSIEVCNGSKYGMGLSEVEWSDIKLNPRNYVFDLDNEHWAYGYQISEIK
jgi:hypothetical protein